MSAQDEQSHTEIEVEIGVGQVAPGGQVAGVVFGSAGSVAISTVPRAQPLDEKTIRAYLEWASQPARPAPDASEELLRLWNVGFKGHWSGAAEPQDLDQVVASVFAGTPAGSFQRLVLLASPGMGKTPALEHCLRTRYAVAALRSLGPGRSPEGTPVRSEVVIPIYVTLARLQSHQLLESLVRDALNSPPSLQPGSERISTDQALELLKEYRCLFLLDDLDELLSERHQGALQTLSQFMERYPYHQYVISCRTSSYGQRLGNLEIVFLDELQDEEAQTILGPEIYDKLSRTSQELVRNRGMVRSFLSLGKSAEALQSKAHLVQFVIRQQQQDNEGIYREHGLGAKVVQGLLEQLAISMRFDRVRSYSERQLMGVILAYLEEWREPIPWRKVEEALSATTELDFDEQTGQWSFRHRTHEAFFSASALVHDPELMERALAQVSDPWWRDVLEILVGLVPKPQTFCFELIDRDVLVAANSIQFAGEAVSSAVADALIDALVEQLSRENSARRQYIVERIGESNHPRATEALLTILHRDWSSRVVMAAVKALRTRVQAEPRAVLDAESRVLHSLADWEEPVINLLSGAEQTPGPATMDRLIALTQDSTQHLRVRGVAAIELGLCGSARAWRALLDLIEAEKQDEFVAWCAVEGLTQCRTDQACRRAGRLLTMRQYRADRWARHRARAVYLLGWLGHHAATDRQVHRALEDDSPLVRGYAVDTLVRRDLIGAREQIEKLLSVETEPFVLRKAAEALGQIGTLDSLALLERHLRQEQSKTRWAVRQAIAEIKTRHHL